MQFSTLAWSALVAVLCLAAVAEGRPATEVGGRQRRSSGRCQPKRDRELLEQRALCPFTTKLDRVFVGLDLEVEKAVLDPECADNDRTCGEVGRGVCTAVKTDITYGGKMERVTLAFVCAHKEAPVQARRTPDLVDH